MLANELSGKVDLAFEPTGGDLLREGTASRLNLYPAEEDGQGSPHDMRLPDYLLRLLEPVGC